MLALALDEQGTANEQRLISSSRIPLEGQDDSPSRSRLTWDVTGQRTGAEKELVHKANVKNPA